MAAPRQHALAPVLSLLLSVGILLIGNGLQATLIAVRGGLEGLSADQLGFVQAGYFMGFVAGSLACAHIIERAGHIRAFSALASIASAATLGHILIFDWPAWMALRLVTGFCFAGLFVVIESWLNASASNEVRGQVFSAYMVVNLLALTLGQLLMMTAQPGGYVLFCLASIIISIALVPVSMTRSATPAITPARLASIRELFRISPLGVFACGAHGLAMSAAWALGPVFGQKVGLEADKIGLFMGAWFLGGFLLQWPVGWLSDRMDRRWVIAGLAVVTAVIAVALPFAASSWWLLLGTTLLFGAASFPICSLTVAHVNDLIPRDDMVAVSSALLLIQGAGSSVGPIAAGFVMGWLGAGGLYHYISVIFVAIAAFALFRMLSRGPVPETNHEHFQPTAATTPQIFGLDPRGESEHDKG